MNTRKIETERLILRPYTLADYQPYLAMCSDPVVTRFLGGQAFSAEDAWNRLLRYAGHWSLLGYGLFAVIEKSTGDYIGETGLANFRRGLGENFDNFGEASWTFSTRVHGLGIAFEAADAAHRWYTDRMVEWRTVCLIHETNTSSLKMAERLGYTEFGEKVYRGQPMIMLQRSILKQ
jgi:RimJ/RimL family protein N-acetyltransferase